MNQLRTRETFDMKTQPGANEEPLIVIETAKPELKKSMNLFHCVALLVSLTGHSAVFISPSDIIKHSGSVGTLLLFWLIGGSINMSLALCFVELGTMMPKAGGSYIFVLHTFGDLAGFVILWGYLVLISGPFWAFQSKTAALYIIKAIFPGCDVPEMQLGIKLLASWIIITLVVLNCVYMRLVTRVQTFLCSTKILALLLVSLAGIAMFSAGHRENFERPFEGSSEDPGSLFLSIFYSLFGYGGWQVLLSMSEEVKNPGRVLPASVYITFTIVIVQYILVNAAYFTLMSPQELIQSRAVALLFMERLYPPLVPVIAVMVSFITIGALNGAIMGHGRLLFAGSRFGHAGVLFGMIHHKYHTPCPGVVVPAGLSLVMLFVGDFTLMTQFITLFANSMSLTCVFALLYLRWKKPDIPRPYKVFLPVAIVQIFVVLSILLMSIYQKPREMGVAVMVICLAFPVYLALTLKHKPHCYTQFIERTTLAIQKIFGLVKMS